MLEPYVLKGTRTVLRRGETSNCLFLFDLISPPHPHKKKYRHYPLKCAIHPRLKEAGEFLHNKVKIKLCMITSCFCIIRNICAYILPINCHWYIMHIVCNCLFPCHTPGINSRTILRIIGISIFT